MTNERQEKLIKIYLYISDVYHKNLQYLCMRHSNNTKTIFSDEELLTVYLFAGAIEQRFALKSMHSFAKEYLSDWFPKLPSYQTFVYRLNRMSEALKALIDDILISLKPSEVDEFNSIVDSMPIMLCTGRNRQGKVAKEIANKGYCSTKELYYYGVKLHLLAYRRINTIPFPERYVITPASENDGTVFKEYFVQYLFDKTIFADKIYQDKDFYEEKQRSQNIILLSPFKKIKNEDPIISQRFHAERELFSNAVSSVRQPIEALFNWLNEKSNIQKACKVRSTNGLNVHIFGKITIAFLYLIF